MNCLRILKIAPNKAELSNLQFPSTQNRPETKNPDIIRVFHFI